MKQLLALLMAIAMAACLISCKGESVEADTDSTYVPSTEAPPYPGSPYLGPAFTGPSSAAIGVLSEVAKKGNYEDIMGTEPDVSDWLMINAMVTSYTFTSASTAIDFTFYDVKESGMMCGMSLTATVPSLTEADYATLDGFIIALAGMLLVDEDADTILRKLKFFDLDYGNTLMVQDACYQNALASFMLDYRDGILTFTIDPTR